MLALSLREGKRIVFDLREFGLGLIEVHGVEAHGCWMKVGIDADKRINILRGDKWDEMVRAGGGRRAV